MVFFFFSSRRRHTRSKRDWSSDVCSSDLELGGAVGTLAGFGPRGEAVQRRTLERLGLGVPPIAWHASRDTIAEFVTLLALIGGTLARIANEVVQLQRSEIMELEEPFAH